MGINSSFLTQTCVQLECELNEQSLLCSDYVRIASHKQYQTQEMQLYQHCYTKTTYKLQRFHFNSKYSHQLSRALRNLQLIKNNHLSNVVFSKVNKKIRSLISKVTQVSVFSQHSLQNLPLFIKQKMAQCHIKQPSLFNSVSQTINFSNIEISNFIHSISGIATEISSLRLPLRMIDPEDFIIMQKSNKKIKYSLQFDKILNQNDSYHHKGYFSPELFTQINDKQLILNLSQKMWSSKYEKNLIFSLGMMIIHFLLMQECEDCYNYKSGEFCESQLEKKLVKISTILQNRLMDKQEYAQFFNQSRDSFSSYERFQAKSDNQTLEEQFEVILYELILGMVCQDPEKRINIKQLKFRSRKLMQNVHKQLMVTESDQTGVLLRARRQKALIISPILDMKEQSFEDFPLVEKGSITNLTTNTDSVPQEQRSRQGIRKLGCKRGRNKEKSELLSNKENIWSQNIISHERKRSEMDNIRKPYRQQKVKAMEDFYQAPIRQTISNQSKNSYLWRSEDTY